MRTGGGAGDRDGDGAGALSRNRSGVGVSNRMVYAIVNFFSSRIGTDYSWGCKGSTDRSSICGWGLWWL